MFYKKIGWVACLGMLSANCAFADVVAYGKVAGSPSLNSLSSGSLQSVTSGLSSSVGDANADIVSLKSEINKMTSSIAAIEKDVSDVSDNPGLEIGILNHVATGPETRGASYHYGRVYLGVTYYYDSEVSLFNAAPCVIGERNRYFLAPYNKVWYYKCETRYWWS